MVLTGYRKFVQIYFQIGFHTNGNVDLIREDIENELFSYLSGILKNYKSNSLQIGGTSGHIHIFCTLPMTITPADHAEEIKMLLLRPLRDLILLWQLKRRALPDVAISKAYGLLSSYID